VKAIRQKLDEDGFKNIPIMSYAVKFASAFYGPFRDAADSAPSFGDRRSYQMDYHNGREAMKEAMLDVEEGTDFLIVKPAMAFYDLLERVVSATNIPVATYSVSGEYSMVKAAAMNGWIDEDAIIRENLLAMKRAGGDIIITYHAKEALEKGLV
jgi:porphobilinogen synthase